ncbi:hypothetical protein SMSP2_02907 [Limihaloglobus sulfuriphilus]|uniref:Uncharacterized protein n=1 Tax=Limihaloglobus sulfuriphilus TaxID=1851148 RepID=A0A1Q2MIK8_9BACT|nr:hypothetical protein [Limihaloglobus sulfuriphilus]AQQ72521.1 hypothetical protein SMSP2_02907 [Limihaloglobus sulfuriphilus]
MSDKLKNSENLTKPFDQDIEKTARQIADKYQIVLTHEDGMWFGRGLEMPTVFGEGSTPDECTENTIEALSSAAATMLEAGCTPPIPANIGKRSEQVNIRLTVEEKKVLETCAKSRGYRGLGDYMRAGALAFS